MVNRAIKLSFIGSPRCGKTALVQTWLAGVFPEAYTPTTARIVQAAADVTSAQGEQLNITVNAFEIGGGADNDHAVTPYVSGSDAIVLCFSLVDPFSFGELEERWRRVSKHAHAIGVPVLLVGCKKDLRPKLIRLDRLGPPGISDAEGEKMAAALDIDPKKNYFECSALTSKGVDEVFRRAIRLGMGRSVLKPPGGDRRRRR